MKYGLVGERLSHSFSKEIHKKIGLYEYEIAEVAREDFPKFVESRDFAGINITIPYKRDIIPYLSHMSERAKKIGAVNVAINRGGELYGYNTDFSGLLALIRRAGFDFSGKTVLIFGTGGSSRTAHAVAEELGASDIVFVSRSGKDGAVTYDEAVKKYKNADFIVNTTPSGMFPDTESLPYDIEFSHFENLSGVVDLIFNPLRSNLVNKALLAGIPAVGGLYMLVLQAVYAAELFTGECLGDEIGERIYKELLSEKENIVLTGMPGSGKSTVGKLVAEKLGKKFYDTDEKFEKVNGNITSYIEKNGEPAFRAEEKRIIKELCESVAGAVISTGGGAVLDAENVLSLRRNGKIYFLDRDISLIKPTKSRPLSADRNALEKRYRERYHIYLSTCDKRIENNALSSYAAKKITEDFFGENTCDKRT